jgi:RNA polymerase sporulation-specific sigma factor
MERTFELIRQSQAGEGCAKEQLIMMHSGLIWNVVRRFMGRGYEAEDLYQIGAIGLIRAIDKFDFHYDVKFSTYAVPLISGEIKRFLRDDGMIKISRSLKENQWKIKKAMEIYLHENGREATIEELSEILGMEPEEIMLAMEAVVEIESMEQSLYNGDGKEISLKERIADEKDEEEELTNKLFLQQLLQTLDKRDLELILLRYFENKTQTQVAEILGISQVQVSRLEKKILRYLKEIA